VSGVKIQIKYNFIKFKKEKKMRESYSKENIMEIINKEYDIFSLKEKNFLSDIVSKILEEIMYKEREIYLSNNMFDKGNGFYDREIQTSLGKININVPRTREGEFRPKVLPDKYTRYDATFEELIKSLITSGDSQAEVIAKLRIKGLNYSEKAVEEIYESIKIKIKDFKLTELEDKYFFVYIDAYNTSVKDLKDGKVKQCAVYTLVGIDYNANKKIIGFYNVFGKENKDTWKSIFQDLITRGLKRVLVFICDDFSGISDAIKTFFPDCYIQKCFVHLQRSIFRNTSKQDCKNIIEILTQIKTSNSFEKAFNLFKEEIIYKYSDKYPDFIKSLDSKIDEYICFLNFPKEIQKHIYTTNPVESVNSGFERIRYRKSGYFQSVDCLEISFFLFIEKMNNKWKFNSIPHIKNHIYELKQIFNLRFYS
jgi:transposase-like protein